MLRLSILCQSRQLVVNRLQGSKGKIKEAGSEATEVVP